VSEKLNMDQKKAGKLCVKHLQLSPEEESDFTDRTTTCEDT